ncbi:hypothetical protein Ahy_A08g037646 isoform C [Arachis hypogaea]|uniref:Uncharacterized protein n=1 Tax=Arachis hypogaea TaxID=3818 RepID=A0A445BRD7_ARAHY|nr:hypothetical protein Ahy_A08g037646 isoform C [Arachis hypogaea]
MQQIITAGPMQESMRNMLPTMQLRSTGLFRQPTSVSLLLQPNHPWWQTQVPLITSTT